MDQKIAELKDLSDTVVDFCQGLGAEDVPLSESSRSRMQALSGYMHSELREAVHLGVKREFAVVTSHYEINPERVCKGYVLPDEDDLTEAEVWRLTDIVEGWARRWRATSRRRWFHQCHPLLLSPTPSWHLMMTPMAMPCLP